MAKKPRPPVGELTDLSPSRIRVADKCGLAFRYQYVDQLPAPMERAATIFGSVVHSALHVWYGMDGVEGNPHQDQSLPDLITKEWPQHLPKEIWRYTMKALEAERETNAVEAAILIGRPDLKAPRTTKAFLKSQEWEDYNEKLEKLIEVCDKREDIRWPKDENPLKAYVKSLQVAGWMQRRWGHLPRPLAVERPFALEFEGFVMRGRLDQFRADPRPGTGEVVTDLVDIKTGRNLHSQMEAFIQAWLYDKAARQMDDLPVADYVSFYMARHDKPQHGRIDPKRHDKLALRILRGVGRKIVMGQFEPSYGHWCDRCDFKALCQAEIDLWPAGTDGIVIA